MKRKAVFMLNSRVVSVDCGSSIRPLALLVVGLEVRKKWL